MHPIPVALFQLGWCLTGGGRVSSWCWGRASLFPTARWLFGKAGAGAFQEPGNPHPLGRLVLSGVELDGWKTELKMALPGQWAGVGRKQLLLSTVQPPGACGEGDGLSPFLDGLWPRWVYLLPCTQGSSKGPTTLVRLGLVGGLMSQSLVGLLLQKSSLHQNPTEIMLWVVSTVWAPWWLP